MATATIIVAIWGRGVSARTLSVTRFPGVVGRAGYYGNSGRGSGCTATRGILNRCNRFSINGVTACRVAHGLNTTSTRSPTAGRGCVAIKGA